MAVILRSLTQLLYKPLKLASDRDLILKSCILLALVTTKGVSELHGLFFLFMRLRQRLRPCRFCTFVLRSLPFLHCEILWTKTDYTPPCPVRAARHYFSRMKQYCPNCSHFFISTWRVRTEAGIRLPFGSKLLLIMLVKQLIMRTAGRLQLRHFSSTVLILLLLS